MLVCSRLARRGTPLSRHCLQLFRPFRFSRTSGSRAQCVKINHFGVTFSNFGFSTSASTMMPKSTTVSGRCSLIWLLVLCISRSLVDSWSMPQRSKAKPSLSSFPATSSNNAHHRQTWSRRRQFLQNLLVVTGGGLVVAPQTASAGAVGEKINAAVTQSDMGLSVRRSVVRGAQVMDGVDGQWEQFSDRFSLGTERSKRDKLPPPKVIPDPQTLDIATATKMLEVTDQVFVQLTNIRPAELSNQIQKVAATVQASFERSGLSLKGMQSASRPVTGQQFNFAVYTRFKAYSDLLIERKVDFLSFRRDFEKQVGQQLVALLLPNQAWPLPPDLTAPSIQEKRRSMLKQAQENIDGVCQALLAKGLVARIDQATLDPEQVDDWSEDLSELAFSIALDGDITMNSQILLQEQGFRLYPNYARYAIQSILQGIEGQKVNTEDYYMDTDYNSDPTKFEVKEVLVNIELESV